MRPAFDRSMATCNSKNLAKKFIDPISFGTAGGRARSVTSVAIRNYQDKRNTSWNTRETLTRIMKNTVHDPKGSLIFQIFISVDFLLL